ncbi:FIVAR domain-containing protein [Anaerococcus sp. Marseille-P3915]|uniref:FIVAR domain-containing protein n=1 Tax=Anaerococcus sp. Marseille-P3915 TaxID=2057799 RepID=UPI001319E257|nr:FIVAR domain-containing protein [Anaerococcus sp. Marseille-P3915]
MKKQLLTSILALGLVLSTPISTINNPSYASEASNQETDTKINDLKAYVNDYNNKVASNSYRLASDESKKAYDQAYSQANEYLKSEDKKADQLDDLSMSLKTSIEDLEKSAKENQKSLKVAIIKAGKLLDKNKEKVDDKDQAYIDINKDVDKAKEILKNENLEKAAGKELIDLKEAINKNFLDLKEKYEDKEEYEVSEEEIKALDKELNPEETKVNGFQDVIDDRDKLLNSHEEFIGSNPYKEAKAEQKAAYNKAYNTLKDMAIDKDDNSNAAYNRILEAVKNAYQERYTIDGKDLNLKTAKIDKLAQAKKDLDVYINDRENIEKILKEDAFKNDSLKDFYKENIEKAIKLKENKEATLEDYTKLNDKLKEITDKIKSKSQVKTVEDARAALKILVDNKDNIKKSTAYTNAEKEAKDAYDKAIKDGEYILNKLANGEKLSLEEVKKAHDKILEAILNLDYKSSDKLQKLVNEDEEFRKSKNYKDLEENSSKKEIIDHYNNLIKLAKEELAKTSPDRANINLLLKAIKDSKDEIDGKLSTPARKLNYEIYISDVFKGLAAYKKPKDKDAAKEYDGFLKLAKYLKDSGKADSKLAGHILEILTNARKYLGGEISKERYTINKNYILLKMVKADEDYKNVNQVSRERLEKALELAEDSMKNPDDKDKQAKALQSLGEVLEDPSIKAIIKKIFDSNPLKERKDLLNELNELVSNDKKLKEGSFKYQKAKKVNRDAYDQALASAKEVVAKDKPSLDEVNRALTNLKKAIENLDGDKFEDSINALAKEFKEKQKLIPQDKRQAMADRINSLNEPGKTMDDYEAVKKEFYDLINDKKVSVTTTTVAPTTSPVQTVTKAGSPVKTGINGIAKVAIILVVAAIIYVILKKKGENNEINK